MNSWSSFVRGYHSEAGFCVGGSSLLFRVFDRVLRPFL